MKKIAFLIHNLHGGGAQRAVANLANSLNDDNNHFYIILFQTSHLDFSVNKEVIDLNIVSSRFWIFKLLIFMRRYFKIRKIRKEMNIDIIISFLTVPNILNILTKNHLSKSLISIRNYPFGDNQIIKKIYFTFLNLIYKRADHLITVSESIKKNLVEKYNFSLLKVTTIYNGINTTKPIKKINSHVRYNFFTEGFINLITVGRLTHQKSQVILVSVMRKLVSKNKLIKLTIIGEGDLRKVLEKEIKTHKLENHIILEGYKKNVLEYLAKADIFVFPSLYEGLPNVILEAMSVGLPVVTTNYDYGSEEILGKPLQNKDNFQLYQYGLRVFKTDKIHNASVTVNGFVDAINLLISSEENYKKYVNASLYRAKNFNIYEMNQKWMSIINHFSNL